RKKGQKIAAKRADKEATEGFVLAKTNSDNNFAAIVMINCETDFVAKNQDFIDYVNSIVDLAIAKTPKSIDELKSLDLNGRTVEESLSDQMGKIGEKIQMSNCAFIEAPIVFTYNHHGNRLATIVGLNKNNVADIENIGHELSMQVAATNPLAVDKDDIDEKIIEREKEIGMEQARQEGKPENILEKIAMGKLNKFFKDNTLLNQDFIRDTKKTVNQYLAEADKELKVIVFKRLMLGEK
ncbi:MAG: elongation factor Ts, partial [Bacteroidales bacterium]|nr:elongation factor Ts [Bacteroidales bacterium]